MDTGDPNSHLPSCWVLYQQTRLCWHQDASNFDSMFKVHLKINITCKVWNTKARSETLKQGLERSGRLVDDRGTHKGNGFRKRLFLAYLRESTELAWLPERPALKPLRKHSSSLWIISVEYSVTDTKSEEAGGTSLEVLLRTKARRVWPWKGSLVLFSVWWGTFRAVT